MIWNLPVSWQVGTFGARLPIALVLLLLHEAEISYRAFYLHIDNRHLYSNTFVPYFTPWVNAISLHFFLLLPVYELTCLFHCPLTAEFLASTLFVIAKCVGGPFGNLACSLLSSALRYDITILETNFWIPSFILSLVFEYHERTGFVYRTGIV